MKTKKTIQASIERHKSFFLQMGILFALGFIFISFEYTNTDIAYSYDIPDEGVVVEVEYVPITTPSKPYLPPPPPSCIFDKIIIDEFNDLPDDEIELIDEKFSDSYETPQTFDIDDAPEIDPDAIFDIAEKMPEFPGGNEALMRYLKDNVRFPSIAIENNIDGRVYVKFVINKQGKISDIQVIKGVHHSLDKEAIRVVQNMPDWTPGSQRGKPVNVAYQLPINFTIR